MKKTKYIAFILLLLALVEACNISSNPNARLDYTYLYDDDQKLISPKFKLFHNDEQSTTLYYQLNSTNILYGKIGGDTLLKARVLVKYKVFLDKNRKNIIDSATIPLVNYGANNEEMLLQGQLKMKVPAGKKYPLEVRFRDANKDLNVVYQLQIDKRENYNEQYFLLKDNEKVLIDPLLRSNKEIQIQKSSLIKANDFLMDYSNESYSMTPPPFTENTVFYSQVPFDSSRRVTFENNQLSVSSFTRINRLSLTSEGENGEFYFYHYYNGFPEIIDIEHLILPIRYISTSSEYKKVKNAINYKKEVDAFWLSLAKEEDKAKKMIKEYYQRVEVSNQFFTSFKEGWKTDRGIIYIVYGIPSTIYKSVDKETWIYGEENNILSVQFDFLKKENKQSNNDFQLVRNSDYKSNWYRAVDMWRQGKIY